MAKVLIPLYEGVTHLDFTGPHQILSTLPGFDVITASLDGAPVVSHGLTFSGLASLETYIPQVEDTIWREFRCQSGRRNAPP
jgi:cyclohexyl-isocyanide hydratase